MKKCMICGKTYESDAPHSKYCSLECGYKAKTMQRKTFNDNHPGYITKYMRDYRSRMKGNADQE